MTKEAISTERALKLALEALDHNSLFTSLMPGYDGRVIEKAYKAINKALAEQQEPGRNHYEDGDVFERIAAMKRRTAEQEPVAWLEILRNNKTSSDEVIGAFLRGHAEYLTGEAFVITSPPTLSLAQRQARSADTWVGLTPEELDEMFSKTLKGKKLVNWVARAIEAKLKEKNT